MTEYRFKYQHIVPLSEFEALIAKTATANSSATAAALQRDMDAMHMKGEMKDLWVTVLHQGVIVAEGDTYYEGMGEVDNHEPNFL